MREVMLTTIDNPYDPFEDLDKWDDYDRRKGYYTAGLLARIAKTSDELSDQDNVEEIERAIDEIIDTLDPYNQFYKKMVKII